MKFRRRHSVKEIEVIDRDGVSLTGIPLRLSKVGGWRENFISVGRFKTFSFIGSVDIWGESFPTDVHITSTNGSKKQLAGFLQNPRVSKRTFSRICLSFILSYSFKRIPTPRAKQFHLLCWCLRLSLNIPKKKKETSRAPGVFFLVPIYSILIKCREVTKKRNKSGKENCFSSHTFIWIVSSLSSSIFLLFSFFFLRFSFFLFFLFFFFVFFHFNFNFCFLLNLYLLLWGYFSFIIFIISLYLSVCLFCLLLSFFSLLLFQSKEAASFRFILSGVRR